MSSAVAIVTGASGGMGRAVAERFAGGHELILVDIDQGRLDDYARSLPGVPATVAGDLADPALSKDIAKTLAGRPLGLIAHTAGLSPSMADAERILAVNLGGTVLLANALLPHVAAGSVFVAIASEAGHRGESVKALAALDDPLGEGVLAGLAEGLLPHQGYAASKFGVQHFVRQQAVPWGKQGARIVSVSPGLIDTPMARAELATAPMLQHLIDMQPVPRFGFAAEIADAVEFLASDKAAFITGTDLLVDGGLVALQRTNAEIGRAMAGQ